VPINGAGAAWRPHVAVAQGTAWDAVAALMHSQITTVNNFIAVSSQMTLQ